MADIQVDQQAQQVEKQEPTKDQAIQQDQTIDEKLKEMEDRFKSELQGLNRKVSQKETEAEELRKKLKEKELATMTAEERIKALSEEEETRKKKIEELDKKAADLVRQRVIDKTLSAINLPMDIFENRIIGETPEEIESDAKKINEFINKEVEKRLEAEINKRLAGKPPANGVSGSSVITYSEYTKLTPKQQASYIKNGGKIEN